MSEHPIAIEDRFKEKVWRRCPGLDPDWAVARVESRRQENLRKNIEIAALMGPEVMRVWKKG